LDSYIQVFFTTDKREEADTLSRLLVEKRLAACVQVVGPITSTYRWKGKMEQAEEWLCIAKSREGLFKELERVVIENHSYDVPEILATPVTAGSKPYLKWLDEQTTNC
jgi:periplasmic divalent cation tolerance protein